ncbi:MAG: UDP-N-acetylglucosamine 1-carboxyvinyltransferase, partial [Clostridia bacterium]|nr:UDP-N-acetylglucosamine 1-carboxyvinyltransferase [Clostridia bacterium]
KDIEIILEIIEYLGGKYSFNNDKSLTVDCSTLCDYELPINLTKKIRASVFMVGAILGRFRKVTFGLPGGCNLGERPIDIHLDALRALGAEIACNEVIYCRVDNLKGNNVTLKYKSVGATESVIMASILAKGKTLINNCALEPEVTCLISLLKRFGAKISGEGTSQITVEGVEKLNKNEVVFSPISDRIEVGTYALSVMATGGEIEINNANFNLNLALFKKIFNNACKIGVNNDKIYIKSSGFGKGLGLIKTAPYPYFPTDLQAPISAYATTLVGNTLIEETVFKDRLKHFSELSKMGANVKVVGNKALIKGVKTLSGKDVFAYDLRGGASMIIAGLKAEGATVINGAEIVDRGYFKIELKLKSLGADIVRV